MCKSTRNQQATPSRSEWSPPASLDVLRTLLADVPWIPQPNVEGTTPVVQIQYSKEFSYIMGVYLSMLRSLSQPASDTVTSLAHTAPLKTFPSAIAHPTTRWLMLLGVVLVKCPSHYTAWKQRRDIVTNPNELLVQCTAEAFCQLPEVATDDGMMESGHNRFKRFKDLSECEKEHVTFWTPSRDSVVVSGTASAPAVANQPEAAISSHSVHHPANASFWRCVFWELCVTARCFVRDFHKNFQLWHHRKELLTWAIEQTPQSALQSISGFNDYLREHHATDLSFESLDERIICNVVLRDEDSKNYHVWSHRSWLLTSLPFFVRPYEPAELRAAVGAVARSPPLADVAAFAPLRLDAMKLDLGVAALLPPSNDRSLLTDELNYTSGHIAGDWFNNSAWCHRFSIFRQYVAEPLLKRLSPTGAGADEANDDRSVLLTLCEEEIRFALRWACIEPCNECPFTYAKGIADLWQLAVLGIASTNCAVVQADAAASPTTAHDESSLRRQGVSWNMYRGTMDLHNAVVDIVQRHVLPVVKCIRAQTTEASSGNSLTRTKFLLNNTHQPIAALFRIMFDRLESTWTTYLTPQDKDAVVSSLPVERFVGNASAQSPSLKPEPWVADIDAWERDAVLLGKELYAMDTVRAKFWKRMVHIVVHRQH